MSGPSFSLANLLDPSFWAQVTKVVSEVEALVNHPTAQGIAQAVADTAATVAETGATGAVGTAVATGVAAVASTAGQFLGQLQPAASVQSQAQTTN